MTTPEAIFALLVFGLLVAARAGNTHFYGTPVFTKDEEVSLPKEKSLAGLGALPGETLFSEEPNP